MQGPGIECGLSIGFDAFLLSFSTNRMLLFTVSLCLCPPGQNSGISNIDAVPVLPVRDDGADYSKDRQDAEGDDSSDDDRSAEYQ